MTSGLAGVVAGLLAAAVTFPLLERRWPASPARPADGSLGTDLAWLAFTPLVAKWFTRLALALLVVLLALAPSGRLDAAGLDGLLHPRGALARQPRWIQAPLFLAVADLAAYAMHRAFHCRPLWRFHAVHHSSASVDWLSAQRVHPVNDALVRVAQAVPLLLLGFDPTVLAFAVPLLVLHGAFVHANLSWRLGPLRHLVVGPVFHRWHHALDEGGTGCNFAALLPVYDRIFGTYHLPDDRVPTRFGAPGEVVPRGLVGQLAFPLRRRRVPTATARPGAA